MNSNFPINILIFFIIFWILIPTIIGILGYFLEVRSNKYNPYNNTKMVYCIEPNNILTDSFNDINFQE